MKTRSRLLLFFLMLGAVPLCAAELVEKIVARVNDRLITHSEFEKRVSATPQGPQAPAGPGELRRGVLDDMIREKLLEERAKELSVAATDEEIETAVEHVKRQYNLATDAEFDSALASANMTREQLRQQMKQTITLQKLIGREVTSKLDISDDMLRLEYERQKENLYKVPEQARVSEIVIRFSPGDPAARESAVERMEQARAKIAAGTPFAEVARQYSQGNARERGGDLGLVSKGELLPPLDAAVFSNPPQEYSPPVLMPGSIHCFRVGERVPPGYRHFADVSEDLKKRIGENLYDRRLAEYVEKLRHEAFIKIYDPELAKPLEKKT
ncbi:MAG TPA: SurA N-terminal domain-containing protein [Thermoanaerobaculia bacterium]|nr:SurA N-terminal domain-containing protein [Thermoanaerobaculia bacterium]